MSMLFIPNNKGLQIDPELIDAAIQWGVIAAIIDETGGPNGEPKLLVSAEEINDALTAVLPEPPDEDKDEEDEGPNEYDHLRDEFQSPHPVAIITHLIQNNCLPCDSDALFPNDGNEEGKEGEEK